MGESFWLHEPFIVYVILRKVYTPVARGDNNNSCG